MLWRIPLPNWGQGCPAAVGNRVFLTCEGGWKEDFPLLLCYDADTGAERWRRELNRLPATGLPAGEQAAIAARRAEVNARYRLLNRLFNAGQER